MSFDHNKEFADYLLKAGHKYTSQRKNVVSELFKIHEHFDIEQFANMLRKRNIKVARATVYSTIKLLLECKLIRKIRMSQGNVVYEHIYGHEHHDHLICLDCDRVVEVHDDDIEARQIKLCESHGFVLESHVHNLYVKCKELAAKGKCPFKGGDKNENN
jgi:Fur family ferric uptake transcriptional regulator